MNDMTYMILNEGITQYIFALTF